MHLADVDLTNPDLFVDSVPHHVFRFLRSEAPVFWHEESGGTLIDDMDEDALSRNRLIMLNMDPPEHRKFRNIVNSGFTPRRIQQLEERIRERSVEILDRVEALGEIRALGE